MAVETAGTLAQKFAEMEPQLPVRALIFDCTLNDYKVVDFQVFLFKDGVVLIYPDDGDGSDRDDYQSFFSAGYHVHPRTGTRTGDKEKVEAAIERGSLWPS